MALTAVAASWPAEEVSGMSVATPPARPVSGSWAAPEAEHGFAGP